MHFDLLKFSILVQMNLRLFVQKIFLLSIYLIDFLNLIFALIIIQFWLIIGSQVFLICRFILIQFEQPIFYFPLKYQPNFIHIFSKK